MCHAVTQLVEAVRYEPKDRGFYSRWSFPPQYGPAVEYEEFFLEVKAAGA
jgi:hypothetical protein